MNILRKITTALELNRRNHLELNRRNHYLKHNDIVSQIIVVSEPVYRELISDPAINIDFGTAQKRKRTLYGWPLIVDHENEVKDGFQIYTQVAFE